MKIAELTIQFDRVTLKNQLKNEITETKKLMKRTTMTDIQHTWMEGYINGIRIAMCLLEELDNGPSEVSE